MAESSSSHHYVYEGSLYDANGRVLHTVAYRRPEETECELVFVALSRMVQEVDGFELSADYLKLRDMSELKQKMNEDQYVLPFWHRVRKLSIFEPSRLHGYFELLNHIYDQQMASYVTHEMTDEREDSMWHQVRYEEGDDEPWYREPLENLEGQPSIKHPRLE